MQDEKINLGKLIEQYRFLIGGILLGLVVASAGLLVYRGNQNTVDADDKIKMLENRVEELEQTKTVAATEATPSNQGSVETGRVKSATTETVPVLSETAKPAQTSAPTKSEPATISGKININTATASQLDSLSGIGPTYAERIIEYREANGGFKSIDEITNVKGIGPKTFEKFKDKIAVE